MGIRRILRVRFRLLDDMPIQIWTGSGFANLAEKKLPEKEHPLAQWARACCYESRPTIHRESSWTSALFDAINR